jgi:hypothetical protein
VDSVDGPPSQEMLHAYDVIGLRSSSGVDVDVKVTGVPVTTSWGAHVKSGVGVAEATPVPSGNTTAPTVSRHADNRSLRRLEPIRPMKRGGECPICRFGG